MDAESAGRVTRQGRDWVGPCLDTLAEIWIAASTRSLDSQKPCKVRSRIFAALRYIIMSMPCRQLTFAVNRQF